MIPNKRIGSLKTKGKKLIAVMGDLFQDEVFHVRFQGFSMWHEAGSFEVLRRILYRSDLNWPKTNSECKQLVAACRSSSTEVKA